MKQRHNRSKARHKQMRLGIQGKVLISFSAIILLALVVTNIFWYANASKTIIAQAESAAASRIAKANEAVEQVLRDLDSLSIAIVFNEPYVINTFNYSGIRNSYENYAGVTSLYEYLTSLYYAKTHISCFTILDNEGTRYSIGSAVVYQDIEERPWFEEIMQNQRKKTLIKYDPEEYDFISARKENVMTIGRQIRTAGGKALGVLLLDFEYGFIESAFSEPSSEGEATFVVNEKGQCIYDSTTEGTCFVLREELGAIKESFAQSDADTMEVEYNGRSCLAIRYHSEYTGWDTISILETRKITADVDALVSTMWLVGIVAILLLVLMAYLVASGITRDLKNLSISMNAFGNNEPLPFVPDSNDEVGDLGRGFVEMTGRVQNLIAENAAKEKLKRQAEYEAMQAQIHPHFLYNALNTVKNLAELQGADNIESVSYSIIELLRATLGNGEQMIPIAKELELTRHYLTIQEYKTTLPFTVEYEVAPEAADILIPKLLIQPLVENALIHGLWPTRRAGAIHVVVSVEEGLTQVTVRDNGAGMDEEEIRIVLDRDARQQAGKLNSIGLCNVNERIKLHYGSQYGVRIHSVKKEYTEVRLEFPVKGQEE